MENKKITEETITKKLGKLAQVGALSAGLLTVNLACKGDGGGGGNNGGGGKTTTVNLATPTGLNVSTETERATWNAVANANGYSIGVTAGGVENIYATATNSYSLDGYMTPGDYSVRVRADGHTVNHSNGDKTNYVTSPFSANVAYNVAEVNKDPYDTPMALYNRLEVVLRQVAGKQTFTAAEQTYYSNLVKAAFVDGFARDKYSENIPFSSKQLEDAFKNINYNFRYTGGSSFGAALNISTNQTSQYMVTSVLHETGHWLCFGESLTSLFAAKYNGADLSKPEAVGRGSNIRDIYYSPFYDNILLNRVGDKAFWDTILRYKSEERYEEMWNKNMNMPGKQQPLISFEEMQTARYVGSMAKIGHSMVSDFASAVGYHQDLWDEFQKMGEAYDAAIRGDESAVPGAREFIDKMNAYNKVHQVFSPVSAITSPSSGVKLTQSGKDIDDNSMNIVNNSNNFTNMDDGNKFTKFNGAANGLKMEENPT